MKKLVNMYKLRVMRESMEVASSTTANDRMETIGDLYKTTGKEVIAIMAGGSNDAKMQIRKRNDFKQFIGEMGPSLHDPSICVRCQGYVHKLNRHSHWNKRFFQLAGHYLRYYQSSKCRRVKGAVDLMELTAMDVDTRYNGVFMKLEFVHRGLKREVRLKMLESQADKWTPELQYFIDHKDGSWQKRPGRMSEILILKMKMRVAWKKLKYHGTSARSASSTTSSMKLDPDKQYKIVLEDSGKSIVVDGQYLLHMNEQHDGDIELEQSGSEAEQSDSESGSEAEGSGSRDGEDLQQYWGGSISSQRGSESDSSESDSSIHEVGDGTNNSHHSCDSGSSSTISSECCKGVCVADQGNLHAVSFETFSTRVKVADFRSEEMSETSSLATCL
jgi:hypothetical protein